LKKNARPMEKKAGQSMTLEEEGGGRNLLDGPRWGKGTEGVKFAVGKECERTATSVRRGAKKRRLSGRVRVSARIGIHR